MPRVFTRLLAPLRRLASKARRPADPWDRLHLAPSLAQYGPGAKHDFPHYLTGDSSVTVASIPDVQDWLLGCEYVTDEVLFHEDDYWQHPATFERLRAGDCEDFALWTWRTLGTLRVDADFVIGYCSSPGVPPVRHAWVVFRAEGIEYLFEPAARERERMVVPLGVVRDRYVPQIGVDRQARRFAFRGYLKREK